MPYAVFPDLPGLQINVTKTPRFSTGLRKSVSGKPVSISYWSYPEWQFRLQFEFLRSGGNPESEYEDLVGFFLNHHGAALPFLLLDDTDNAVQAQPFGVGNGSKQVFQLVRSWSGFTEPIFGTVGDPVIYEGGVSVPFTLLDDGKVSLSAAPANGAQLTWSGQFYFRVHFKDDGLDFERFLATFWRTRSVMLESWK